jgi:hypothetical protein
MGKGLPRLTQKFAGNWTRLAGNSDISMDETG